MMIDNDIASSQLGVDRSEHMDAGKVPYALPDKVQDAEITG